MSKADELKITWEIDSISDLNIDDGESSDVVVTGISQEFLTVDYDIRVAMTGTNLSSDIPLVTMTNQQIRANSIAEYDFTITYDDFDRFNAGIYDLAVQWKPLSDSTYTTVEARQITISKAGDDTGQGSDDDGGGSDGTRDDPTNDDTNGSGFTTNQKLIGAGVGLVALSQLNRRRRRRK